MEVKFKKVSDTETRFEYKGHKLLLVSQSRGVYGMGQAVQLYEMKGLEKVHVKEIAWLKDDGGYASRTKSDAGSYYTKECVTLQRCEYLALEYLSKIID
jgi:hypothetical protein